MVMKGLFLEWLSSIPHLLRLAHEDIYRQQVKKGLSERMRKSSIDPCTPVSDPAFKRPDPMIYSQQYLMKQGIAVTWDNPDIELQKDGILVTSNAVEPDKEYDIIARIWNNSNEAPVVGLPVRFLYLSFGVGTQKKAISDTKVDLGVKGSPNHPAFAKVKWKTPPTPGHYCIQVSLEWADDANHDNNLGQENVNVITAHSPAEFYFALRNDTDKREVYYFETDSYIIPELAPCDQKSVTPKSLSSSLLSRQAPGTIIQVPVAHMRDSHPLPSGWIVTFDPSEIALDPREETSIKTTIKPVDGFRGQQAINIHAFNSRGLAGGVSIYVKST